jgi:AbrB family looped-hinge helix DNA binding protein
MLRLRSKPADSQPGEADSAAATQRGTVRAVDALGRIVIPAELRRVADIQSGDCLDFSYVDGSITLTKTDAGETNCVSHW